jgi:hypothetical protein
MLDRRLRHITIEAANRSNKQINSNDFLPYSKAVDRDFSLLAISKEDIAASNGTTSSGSLHELR